MSVWYTNIRLPLSNTILKHNSMVFMTLPTLPRTVISLPVPRYAVLADSREQTTLNVDITDPIISPLRVNSPKASADAIAEEDLPTILESSSLIPRPTRLSQHTNSRVQLLSMHHSLLPMENTSFYLVWMVAKRSRFSRQAQMDRSRYVWIKTTKDFFRESTIWWYYYKIC